MSLSDPQPIGRLLHVCPDVTSAEQARRFAEAAGVCYRRFGDAFAAAAFLLACPEPRPTLLLAADAMTEPELGICRWAAERWPSLPVWAHGAARRLRQQPGHEAVRMVELPDLPVTPPVPAVEQPATPEPPAATPEPPAETTEPPLRLRPALPPDLAEPLLTDAELAALLDPEDNGHG